ncbi:hypothetical protein NOM01_04390 [Sporolactobacillus sp. STSJ-5]|uniref:hypothetical protein n=1 Tax=Sporolactobacillus sp. STSJ-5 TaxID=2965076 RepID=UPI0021031134|nr:hypothetical protein [Sporolactobacillus sp. STSJ-5]MCQ2009232.1 hypothetical protein [Sporolactobacillus sp. STSJ-5]
MIKPFIVDGHEIKGELLEKMEQNGLGKANVQHRIRLQKWTPEEAVSVKKGEKRPPRAPKPRKPLVNPANGPVKTYFLSEAELEELHKRVGKPGEHCKDYGDNRQPIALRGAWHG